jgi:hypothetical protein
MHVQEADQHRERDNGSSDQGGAQIAQKQEQNNGYEDKALEQILLYGLNGSVDDGGLIVKKD